MSLYIYSIKESLILYTISLAIYKLVDYLISAINIYYGLCQHDRKYVRIKQLSSQEHQSIYSTTKLVGGNTLYLVIASANQRYLLDILDSYIVISITSKEDFIIYIQSTNFLLDRNFVFNLIFRVIQILYIESYLLFILSSQLTTYY